MVMVAWRRQSLRLGEDVGECGQEAAEEVFAVACM
jgi:hypothetical protein